MTGNTELQTIDNFSVGADLRVRPKKGAHAGAPLQGGSHLTATAYKGTFAEISI